MRRKVFMSETEPFPGFFPLPNVVADTWLPQLKDTELRMLLVIIRQTAGFVDPKTGARKERDWLSQSRLKQATGRAEGPLARAIASLIAQELIIAEDEMGQPLETAAHRRRHLGRIYYRLGLALTVPVPTAQDDSPLAADAQAVFPGVEVNGLNAENTKACAQSEEASAESGMPNVHMTKYNSDKRISRMQFPPTTLKNEALTKREALKSYEQPEAFVTEAQKVRVETMKAAIRERLTSLNATTIQSSLSASTARRRGSPQDYSLSSDITSQA